jgi:L-ascorbate metabolism protein UlaG (beta-lactamase superfamily)
MQLTYFGHASFSVVIKGKHILFDPFISANPLAKNIDVNTLSADYIFVSHGHGDHVLDVATIAKRTNAKVVANPEVSHWFAKQGVSNLHEVNHGSSVDFGFGHVRAVNAIHSSGLPDGAYGGNPMGFVFTTDEGNFYYTGDTALSMEMQLIPLFTKLDFAVLPIGGNYTMDFNDAVLAAGFIQCDKIVGIHYNTFPVIHIDTEKALAAFANSKKTLLLPQVGETITM